MALSPAQLAQRAEIGDVVLSYATAIDGRDWNLLRSILTDPVHIDYSSMGSLNDDMPAEAWVTRLKSLYGFDATLHMISNLTFRVSGETAVCTSYVNAMHFLNDAGREYGAHACGVYVHELVRSGGAWKIRKCTFRLAGRQSGDAAFEAAFARARELAPGRTPEGQ